MPLSRYQLRNEYSLADPELYKAADKDDPEALLEGVAMAGLVGVLRQLGDLAEFAAEVFHDLHEEVIATAARGHSLMVRVQQLEAEVPSIEKAFLSQTNHSSFFYNAGIDWHPNMNMDQNLITRGDMPRFIMDSYEECRGPPRLFLLDKFDVAGAGSCLKRYTDPSFFKMEASVPEIINLDVQLGKRTRRGKKKGSRWRNGETPEVLSAPHAKLHQLLLEERIENVISDPARPVKLKRRLNGFPFDSRTGKSYMEKFLKIPSPEHELVHEISVCSSPLKLPASRTYESGLDIHDISLQSPDKKFRRGSISPARVMVGAEQKLPMDKLDGVTSDSGIYESPVEDRSFKVDNVLSTFHMEVGEKEIVVDGETRSDDIIDGYQSDGVASEVDNYMDALATMESEMDTDSELRSKSDFHVSSNRRRTSGFGATSAEHQAPFSDSQSRGSSMLSEDGNFLKREMLSSSYSDTRSISTENTPLEGEVSSEGFLVNEICEEKGTARPLKEESIREDIVLARSAGHANNGGTKVAEIPAYRSEHREKTISNVTILPPTLSQMDAASTLSEHVMVDREAEEMLPRNNGPETELINNTGSPNVGIPSAYNMLDAPLQIENDSLLRASAEKLAIDDLDDNYLNVDKSLPYLSNIPCYTRDAASLADSAESLHLEDLKSEENFSSLFSTHLHTGQLVHNNSNMTEHPCERSPKDLPYRFDGEDPNVISGATNDIDFLSCATNDIDVLNDASVDKPNTIDIASEDEKSKNSQDSIPQRENDQDNHVEDQVCNQICLPISVAPHAEELSPSLSLPEFETRDTATESDHIVSAPDDVILRATEEEPLEQGFPELDIHHPARESDDIVSESDDGIPAAAVVAGGGSYVRDSPEHVCSEALHLSGIQKDIQPLDPTVNSTEDQMDSPIPAILDLDEKSLESSVMGSPKDVHSKDLSISGIIDNIQPLDPAVNLTGNQGDSMIQVAPQLDHPLDLTWSEAETLAKDKEPGDEIIDVNKMIPPVGEVAGDIKTKTENPNICDLKEQQASVIPDGFPQLDSAEAGILDNAKQNLHEHPSSEDVVKMNRVAPCIDFVGGDIADSIISPDGNSLTRNVNLREAVTASLASFNENAEECGVSKLDKESISNFEESKQNQNEAGVTVQYGYSESEVCKELGQLKVSTPVSGSDLSETLRHDHTEPESSLGVSNAATTSTLPGSGLGTIPSKKSNFTNYAEDTSLLPIRQDGEEKEVKLSFDQLDTGQTKVLENAAKASLEPLPQLKQKGSLDEEGCSNTASVSSLGNIQSQLPVANLLPTDNYSIGGVVQPRDPSSSSIAFQLLPEAKFNLEEMPPLPPLPPVQWRMGKQQHASSVLEKQALPRNSGAFPSFSQSISDQKAETSMPLLPHYEIAGEDSHLVNEYTSRDQVYDGPFPLHLAPVANHENNTNNSPPLGETRSMRQLFPLSEKFNDIPRDDSRVGEKEKVQPSFCTMSQGTSMDAASTYASKLPHDEASKLQHLVAQETSSKDEKLDQVSAHSDGNIITHVEEFDEIRQDDSDVGEKENVQRSLSTIFQGASVDAASTYSSKMPHDEASKLEYHVAPETSSNDKKLDQVSAHSDGNIITYVEMFDEIPRDDSHFGEKEIVQSGLNTISQGTSKDASSTYASKVPHDEASQFQHHVALETSQKDEKLDQVSALSDGNIAHDGDVLPSKIGNEQPQIVMSSPMGEIAWPAQDDGEANAGRPAQDDGKANAGRTTKLPRPRNPLIDAVVAHDKSKLRKVTENPRPPIQKADERDSLLEQIRSKSFNLKRTVVSRPSIQGPTTNLRVAAILEKAKTIRQAFAGSDEDDDSWSDS